MGLRVVVVRGRLLLLNPGPWFIGLQGMKVNQGRKTKSSVGSLLNSYPLETRSRVPYREKLVGHEGDTQAKHLGKSGNL